MPASIFSGDDVKLLKNNLDFNGNFKIIEIAVDPTSVATSGDIGTIAINHTTAGIWQKTDAGSSTNWTDLTATGGGFTAGRFGAHTGNGVDTTNSQIRRYTTTYVDTGSLITLADAAATGTTFTFDRGGLIFVNMWDSDGSGNVTQGVSLNGTPATAFTSLAATARVAPRCGGRSANEVANTSGVFTAATNDVLRVHGNSGNMGTASSAHESGVTITIIGA